MLQSKEKKQFLTATLIAALSSKRNSPDRKQLKSLFKSMSFKQLIASPTRMVEDSASLVDLIATNCRQKYKQFRSCLFAS